MKFKHRAREVKQNETFWVREGSKGKGRMPRTPPHLSRQLLKQLLQPQLQGNVGGLRRGGEFSSGQEGLHPTPSCPLQEQPLTARACKSALITSSISLQVTDRKWGRGRFPRALGWGPAGSQRRGRVGSGQDSGALGWGWGFRRRVRGPRAHTAVWRRSEKMRSVKSASSPARAALGTTR